MQAHTHSSSHLSFAPRHHAAPLVEQDHGGLLAYLNLCRGKIDTRQRLKDWLESGMAVLANRLVSLSLILGWVLAAVPWWNR